MKKFFNGICITAFLISAFCLMSCHNMCADLEKTIGAVCWYDRMEWKDVSKTKMILDSLTGVTQQEVDGQNVITYTKGNNFAIGTFGSDVKGFEAEVKLNSGDYVSIGLKGSGYDCYYIKIYKANNSKESQNKKVEVYYTEYKNGKYKYTYYYQQVNGISNPAEYNSVKMEIQKNRSVKVILNNNYVCTISNNDFSFGSLTINSSTTCNCNFKIKKILR